MNGGSSNNPTESVELLWYEVGTYNYRRIRERTIYLYNKRPKLSSNWFRTSGERSSTKRHNNDTTLLKGGRLFQQYLVDAYTTIEEQRLKWTRNNQDTLRMDLYHYLYDAVTRGDTSETGCYNDNLALMLSAESDEVIRLEKESRSKLSDLIRPFDYAKLNSLYDLFVPQREKSSEQCFFSERSRVSHITVQKEKKSFNKQPTFLEKRLNESISLGKKCKSYLELVNVMIPATTIANGVEMCKKSITKSTYFGYLDPFIKNTIEQNFSFKIERVLTGLNQFQRCLKEEMVADLRYFNSLESEVDSLRSQLETQKTQSSNEIDRLLREYYYADHMNAILGVYTKLDEVTNLQCDYLELLQKYECLETELSKSKMMSKSFESVQKHAINLELELQQCKEKDLKAQLQDKSIVISELKKLIEKLKGKSVDTKVTNLEKDVSEIKQVDQYAQALSFIPGIVDRYIDNNLGEAIHKAIQSHNVEFSDFATPVIERNITESLKDGVIAKYSSQPKSTYEGTASLSVKSYNTDKDLFDTYGEVFSLKRGHGDKDKDQDPSAGSERGTKRRKSSKEAESSKDPRSKEGKSSSSSKGTSRSRHKSSGKSAHADEPSHTVNDSEVCQNQEFDTRNNNEQPDDEDAPKNDWFKKPKRPLTPNHNWDKRQRVDFRPP
uniref:Helitron helicase-like domain-containing protein n=1 Tax=Tanacetum cinerariifolium TaxID=118510 RepID=A0A6L2P6C8_TANCI|nr:hypothetical protein CTI12_AA376470 [Tanacetum cinerariifolium]